MDVEEVVTRVVVTDEPPEMDFIEDDASWEQVAIETSDSGQEKQQHLKAVRDVVAKPRYWCVSP